MGRRKSIIAIEGFNHKNTPIPVATRVDNIVYTGGISGFDIDIDNFVEGPEAQAKLTFEYVRKTMEAAGGSVDDIVRMTFYVSAPEVRAIINKEWLAMFPDPEDRPARHVMAQAMPAHKFLVCDAVAVLEN
jgi:2-iminobutanoate/2-iminopropanoate deaminase